MVLNTYYTINVICANNSTATPQASLTLRCASLAEVKQVLRKVQSTSTFVTNMVQKVTIMKNTVNLNTSTGEISEAYQQITEDF